MMEHSIPPTMRNQPQQTRPAGLYIKTLSLSEDEDLTASTDELLSDCLSEVRCSNITPPSESRQALDKWKSAGNKKATACANVIPVEKNSDHSDRCPSPQQLNNNNSAPKAPLLLDVPLHRDVHHWRQTYDSLSFLKAIETVSDDDDDEVSEEETSVVVEAESDDHDDLERLCSKDSKRIKLLGQGAYGDVYQIIHRRRAYALKVCAKFDLVTDGVVQSVLQERNIARSVHHPFICSLVASKQDEDFLYMLQEYCAGGDFYSLLERFGGKLRESSARFYVACIADAVAYLHERSIAHRDLKPENIMLDALGYPRLIDFGCAKLIDAADRMTRTMCGTPRFVSPEMIDPETYGGGHSFGTDYWALGILMYEMLMGSNPYEYDGMSETEVYSSILDDDFQPSLSDEHSTSAQDFLSKLLVHDPARRLGRRHDSRVLQHRWFADVDLVNLRKKPHYAAPWSPDLSDSSDSHYFDDWDSVVESKFSQSYPTLSSSQRHLFANF